MTFYIMNFKPLYVFTTVSFLIFNLASIVNACDRNAVTTYMKASEEMQTLDSSVHKFIKSLYSKKDIELLIFASTAPDYIAEFHQRLSPLIVNQPAITDDLNEFYLCSGLQQEEIDDQFKDTFDNHYQLLDHLQKHDTELHETTFSAKINDYHRESVTVFGDQENGILQPLKVTENIFQNITKKYAQQATIFDFWKLKEAQGTEYFMNVTGLNIEHYSPKAQLQKHLDRGLSKDSFMIFGAPADDEEYPQSIYHLAHELSGQISNGPLPTVDELPNRSKLAIIIKTSEDNKQELSKILNQFETAVQQFKQRAAQKYHIKDWQHPKKDISTARELLHNWAVNKLQYTSQQADIIDELLDAKSSKDWSTLLPQDNS